MSRRSGASTPVLVRVAAVAPALLVLGCSSGRSPDPSPDPSPVPDPRPSSTLCLVDRTLLTRLAAGSALHEAGSVDAADVRRRGATCRVLDDQGRAYLVVTVTDDGPRLDRPAARTGLARRRAGLASRCDRLTLLVTRGFGYVCEAALRTEYAVLDRRRLLRLRLTDHVGVVSARETLMIAASFADHADHASD